MVAQENSGTSFAEACQQPVDMVKEYPFSSMMVVFGTGMVLGVMAGQMMVESSSHRTSSYFEPANFTSNFSHQMSSMLDRFSRQFQDVVQNVIPDMVNRCTRG